MKRLLCVVLCILLVVAVVGCGNGEKVETVETIDEHGSTVTEDEFGKNYNVAALPFTMDYQGEEIRLESIDFYENKADYEYRIFAVVCLDISKISAESFHWIFEDPENSSGQNEFGTIFECVKEDAGYDFEDKSPYMYNNGSGKMYLIYMAPGFISSAKTKDSFTGANVSYRIYLKQDEKREEMDSYKTNDYRYEVVIPSEIEYFDDAMGGNPNLPDGLYESVLRQMHSFVNNLANALS